MPRVCQICSHSERLAIDRELVKGGNMMEISDRYDVTYSSVCNHKDNHLSRQLVKSEEIRQMTNAQTIAEDISSIYERLNGLLDKAERENHTSTFLDVAGEIRSYSEFLLRLQLSFQRLAQEEAQRVQEAQKVRLDLSTFSDDQLKSLMLLYTGSVNSELACFMGWLIRHGYFSCPDCGQPLTVLKIPTVESKDLHGAGREIQMPVAKPRPPELQMVPRRRRTDLDS
jgi:hypothetical protein